MAEDNNVYDELFPIADNDCLVLVDKGASYGNSWKKRGGIGAFMMLARKWDRIELQCEKRNYDIFQCCLEDRRAEGLLDDIQDLRRYLLLVENEVARLTSQSRQK